MKTDESGREVNQNDFGITTSTISEVQSGAEKSPLNPPYRKSIKNSATKFNIWPNSNIDPAAPALNAELLRIP